MDNDERYLDRLEGRKLAESSYASLADCAEDEASDELVEYIQDEMHQAHARDTLIKIASIWQSRGTTQEKYALIGDAFQKIIDFNAAKKTKGM